jgi:hypothetical protein
MKRIVIAAVVAAAVACDHSHPTSGTAPGNGARASHLQYGRTANGFLNAPDTAQFYIEAQAGDLIAAYAASPDSTVTLWFADSGQPFNDFFFINRGTAPGTKPVFTFTVPATGQYELALVRRASPGAGQAQYALQVDTVYTGPEHLKSAITVGQIVSGESIDSIGDIDIFTFNGTAGKEVVGYLQAIAKSADGVTMSIYATNPDSVLTQVASAGGDTALEYYASNPLTLPTTGTYHVKLNATLGSYVGPYRFEIYPVDSAPESISANVTPGDTVQGESIDHVYDLDVFTVKAKAGASYNLFAQYSSAPRNTLQVVARDASGTAIAALSTTPGPALTAGSGSGPFTAPASGQFTITVSTDGGILNRGPYRFFLYSPNSAPEIAPANFNLGDSVTTETIGLPGDTDIFSMHVASTTLATICVTPNASAAITGGPVFVVYGPSGNIFGEIAIQLQSGGPLCTPNFTVAPGNYSIVIADPSPFGTFRGLYKINTYAFSSAPEHVSPVITLGDTVKGESIDVPGDYDVFRYKTHAYSLVGIDVVSGMPDPSPSWSLAGTGLPYQQVYGGTGVYGRVDMDSAATYTFVMQSNWANVVGPYKFVFYPWPVAPEHHAATVTLGSSITDEAIDFPGDVDQFTMTGPAGGYGIVSLQTGPGIEVQALVMPSDSTVTTSVASAGYLQYSQRFQMPASGSVLLRLRAYPFGGTAGTGTYAVSTVAVNPAPEHVSAATTIGDTVSGESIDYPGDLDQFTFNGTAGQKIVVEFQTPQGVGGNSMVLQLLAPDGTVLGQVTSINPFPLPSQTTGVVTLPTTGQYTIAVSGGANGQSPAVDPYVFAILPSP